jgi:copper oxidase (laccase) domain-containing protein
LIFSSQELGVVGVVHMGWKSAREGILKNIPYDLASFKVAAGVAMRKDCYEVGKEFFDYPGFAKHLKQDKSGGDPSTSLRVDSMATSNHRIKFDPIGFAKEYLFAKGLKEENFYDTDLCSICKNDLFFFKEH